MIVMFENLRKGNDIVTSVALGLTCKSLYEILKCIHPMPIALLNVMFIPKRCTTPHYSFPPTTYWGLLDGGGGFLGDIYRGIWAGDMIRNRNHRSYHFLNIKVYGKKGSATQRRFEERMQDYVNTQYITDNHQSTHLLPPPMGKGFDWYGEVQAVAASGPSLLCSGDDENSRDISTYALLQSRWRQSFELWTY